MFFIITIDDGYEDCYKIAFPVFKKENVKASFFPYIKDIGEKFFFKWNQIDEMRKNGMNFGSYSISHFLGYKLFKNKSKKEIIKILTK